ncbi:hypothetical protein Cgig2_021683 [Carnegiea gigantea]|uniref:Uncharacterized protein n=1 Tax=Carnegiea gigantea TaxID=171969 RepID=A0A9Q1QPC9_9CARY|nr:hypothetical protein Cgig2_021683 [Carnegiea gigantea]
MTTSANVKYRRPRHRKPTAVHGTPCTSPTRGPRAQKRHKDMTEGMMAVGTVCTGNDPGGEPKGMHANASANELAEAPYQCVQRPELGTSLGGIASVILHNKAHTLGKTWDSFKPTPHADLRGYFCVSFEPTAVGGVKYVTHRILLALVLLWSNTYADMAQWEIVTLEWPEQRNYVDCVIMVSQWTDALYFDQDYVQYYRDKRLLSFIQGRVAHFR